MTFRDRHSWQLILADLALILFLVTVAALAEHADDEQRSNALDDDPLRRVGAETTPARPTIAQAQALYRTGPDSPSIEQWLKRQSPDPRATLSVIALHRPGDQQQAWEEAQALANAARASGVAVRIVVQEGQKGDLYASLAFDTAR